jgi:starch-binding outer membrane protein, SusD/RagB family
MTIRSIAHHWASLAPALAVGLILPACDILDVNNPSNLTEESVESASAANAVVNGAVAQNARGIATQWLGYLIATDEIVWIGSRDAWGQLDQGFLSNRANEFTDAAFPQLAQARWLADRAVALLDGHVAETPTPKMKRDQARAYLQAGIIYMIIGETQEDFAFSDKQEAAASIGPAQMRTVLDKAIEYLDKAVTFSQALEEEDDDLVDQALAVRARAKHSRAQWDKIKPTPNTAQPLVDAADAASDAMAVLARVNDDWRYQLEYSSSTLSNYMASEINSRGEQQFDTTSVVEVNAAAPKTILGVKLKDPISNQADPRIRAFLEEWKGEADISVAGTTYAPLTLVSARHMLLILAEDELQKGNTAGFTTYINRVRAVNNLPAYSGQIPALDMLKYERRAALFVTGVRLLDMYRFGIADPLWHPSSDVLRAPGTLLPITCIEANANPEIPDC